MKEFADTKSFATGSTIFGQGEAGDCAYLINAGRVEIIADGESICVLEAGEIFGEMSLIDGRPRTADARALDPCELVPVTRDYVTTRLEKMDPLMRLLLKLILRRYRDFMCSEPEPEPVAMQNAGQTQRFVARELKMSTELRGAILRHELDVHFQPIVRVSDNRVAGFEALARWQHPDAGFVPPPEFIRIAEESGLILQLGRYVLERACKFQQRMSASLGEVFLSVNISAHQLYAEHEVGQLLKIVQQTGVSPELIKMEITESVLLDDPERAERAIGELRGAGMRIAIDDFGTGYSSLSYLHRFALDTLKVDRSFITPLPDDPAGLRIVRAILGLARELDLSTVAEGVEDEAQLSCLAELNCDYVQGYLVSRPLPESEVENALAQLAGASGESIAAIAVG